MKKNRMFRPEKYIFIPLLLFVFHFSAQGQGIHIYEEPQVSDMLSRHIEANKSKGAIEGWRIQILSSSDRARVEREKSKFRATFPQYPVDWVHIKPNYKLQAAAFASKLDALEALNRIKSVFPSAYVVKVRDLNPREIVGW